MGCPHWDHKLPLDQEKHVRHKQGTWRLPSLAVKDKEISLFWTLSRDIQLELKLPDSASDLGSELILPTASGEDLLECENPRKHVSYCKTAECWTIRVLTVMSAIPQPCFLPLASSPCPAWICTGLLQLKEGKQQVNTILLTIYVHLALKLC